MYPENHTIQVGAPSGSDDPAQNSTGHSYSGSALWGSSWTQPIAGCRGLHPESPWTPREARPQSPRTALSEGCGASNLRIKVAEQMGIRPLRDCRFACVTGVISGLDSTP